MNLLSKRSSQIGLGLLLLTSWCIGWFSVRTAQNDVETTQGKLPSTSSSRLTHQATRVEVSTIPSEITRQLANISAAPNHAERMRSIMALVQSIPTHDITLSLENGWSSSLLPSERAIFFQSLVQRWQKEDPEAMLGYLMKHEHFEFIDRYAQSNPSFVIDFLRKHPDAEEIRILSTLAQSHPHLVAEQLAEWLNRPRFIKNPHSIKQILHTLTQLNPEAIRAQLPLLIGKILENAQEALLVKSLDENLQVEIKSLIESHDGMAAFKSIIKLNNYGLGPSHSTMCGIHSYLLDHYLVLPDAWKELVTIPNLLSFDPQKILNENLAAKGLSAEQIRNLQDAALTRIVYTSTENDQILPKILELATEQNKSNLLINYFQMRLLRSPEKIKEELALINDIKLRETIEQYLPTTRPSVQIPAKPNPALQPKEWIKQMDGGDAFSILRPSNNQDRDQIAQIMTAYEELPDQERREKALLLAEHIDDSNNLLTSSQQQQIFADALKTESPNRNIISNSIEFAVDYIIDQPDAAVAWASQLPDGETKIRANMVLNWLQTDPPAAHAWMETFSADEKALAESYIKRFR